jgi:hypothetical protein
MPGRPGKAAGRGELHAQFSWPGDTGQSGGQPVAARLDLNVSKLHIAGIGGQGVLSRSVQ